jgi:hypothetical protein
LNWAAASGFPTNENMFAGEPDVGRADLNILPSGNIDSGFAVMNQFSRSRKWSSDFPEVECS